MTEDDTFRILKQTPFSAVRVGYDSISSRMIPEYLASHNWTVEEFFGQQYDTTRRLLGAAYTTEDKNTYIESWVKYLEKYR